MNKEKNCQKQFAGIINDIRKLRSCAKFYQFDRLDLKGSMDERDKFLLSALEEMKLLLEKGGGTEKVLQGMLEYVDRNYSPDWFLSAAICGKNKEKDKRKITRMLRHILDKGAEVAATNLHFTIKIDRIVNGIAIHEVRDKVDILLKKDGTYEAIKLILRVPDSSYRARKELNVVENNLHLLGMASAFGSTYPNLKLSVYSLRNKDDSGTSFPDFENKRGNSIVSTTFDRYKKKTEEGITFLNTAELTERFKEAAALSDTASCDGCYQKSLCRFRPEIRYPDEDEKKPESSNGRKAYSYTEKQLQVVQHINGPMNVIAVPGAGKTRSLVGRLDYLIHEARVWPSNILFLTFTKKACTEIENRVAEGLEDPKGPKPHIFTFHGFGYRILRDNPTAVGCKVKLAAEVDRLGILSRVIAGMPAINGVSYDPIFTKLGFIHRLDEWITEIEEEGVEKFIANRGAKIDAEGVVRVYNEYRRRFEDEGYINYNDQINLVNKMFEDNPDILKMYSRLYKFIMVDEYQDVNEEQAKLVYSLASHGNLVVVGDDDQSIYSFRGGSSSYLLEFPNVFDFCKTVFMEDNFRSNDKILKASETLIRNNSKRIAKDLVSHVRVQNPPLLINKGNEQILLKYVSAALEKYQPGEIAIISRNNGPLISLADFLSQYVKVSAPKDYLIEDTAFLLILDLFKLYYGGIKDDCALYRLAMLAGVNELLYKTDSSVSLYQNLLLNGDILSLDVNDITAYRNYFNQKDTPSPLFQFGLKIMRSFKLIQYCTDPQHHLNEILFIWSGKDLEHPVAEILANSMDERRMENFRELYEHMQRLVLFDDGSRVGYEASKDAINLLTAHDSKGKEFPFVFIYGVDDFNGETKEQVEEARKLLFVAMTRAKQNLVLFGLGTEKDILSKEISSEVRVV